MELAQASRDWQLAAGSFDSSCRDQSRVAMLNVNFILAGMYIAALHLHFFFCHRPHQRLVCTT